MSYESTLELIDRCNNGRERYLSYYSNAVGMLKNNFSGWHDDVGIEAYNSLKNVSDCWYDAVKGGFGCVYDSAKAIKSAYLELKSVKQEVERAVTSINMAEARIK